MGTADGGTERNDPLLPILEELAGPAEPAPAEKQLGCGDRIGRFELVRELGRGGFGQVFEARDRDLGRRVALKLMARPVASLLRREAETAARLNHPNIVTLYDFGVSDGLPYLVLELLQGETLEQRLARGPLSPAEATGIGADIARALE